MKVYKLFFILILVLPFVSCSEDELSETNPFIMLKSGNEFTIEGAYIPVGGQMKFGISAIGDGATITNLTVQRITETEVITELDKGMYLETASLDTTLIFMKSSAEKETWRFSIMNDHRDTTSVSTIIYKGEGSAYGDIDYFPSIIFGYQNATNLPFYVDLHSGIAYDNTSVAGNEAKVDLISYYYLSSGKSSPTISCPAYETARSYHISINDWTTQNSVLYDYETCDNDLISENEFDVAQNDSLMINTYIPNSTSGTCKFCYSGKIIPFKTANGKYGLIKVIHADEIETGSIKIAVKIQK